MDVKNVHLIVETKEINVLRVNVLEANLTPIILHVQHQLSKHVHPLFVLQVLAIKKLETAQKHQSMTAKYVKKILIVMLGQSAKIWI
jgi:hypothetical protein